MKTRGVKPSEIKNMEWLNKTAIIDWYDSYGAETGWRDISNYSAVLLNVTSWGKVIFEDDKVVALAQNYAEETDNTCEQANGIMVIPKSCIIKITSF